MGKEHANTAHYKEICSVLDAWIEEEEEPELKVTIARVKPLIKVQNWTYVDEQDFSLAEEAERRKENAKSRHQEYADYDEVKQVEIEDTNEENGEAKTETTTATTTTTVTTTTTEENIDENKESNTIEEENKPKSAEDEAPEEKDTKMEEGDEDEADAEGEEKEEKEELAERKPRHEREERDDSVHLDDDMFHKLGYGITSTVTLTSKDEQNTATLHLYYSSHNWDIKDYEKPDFSLFCFTNTISLSWETANEIKNTENTNNTENTENNNTTTSENTEQQKPEDQKKMKKLITGIIDGDRKQFTTKVRFTSANLSELRSFLKYDEKDEIFFTEENFVMLLYFACVSMSIEDQPFNESPALLSSRARRFFMKQVLYELGANVNQYKYVIENISYAMEEIKEQAAQDRYSFRGTSSSKIVFDSDDEEEPSAKRGRDESEESAESKKIKQ